jgi:hypothetical protein
MLFNATRSSSACVALNSILFIFFSRAQLTRDGQSLCATRRRGARLLRQSVAVRNIQCKADSKFSGFACYEPAVLLNGACPEYSNVS